MLEMVKEWLQSYIRSHGVRAVVSMVISGLLYLFVNESAVIYVEQTIPLLIGACIFAAIALLSLAALYFRDGMDFLLIVGAVRDRAGQLHRPVCGA